jgi:hypothetical protein
MASYVQDPYAFAWSPQVHVKRDPKQLSFNIPPCLIPTARCVLHKRYVEDFPPLNPTLKVSWVDETKDPIQKTVQPIRIPDSYNSIEDIPASLPSNLLQTKIRVLENTKEKEQLLVVITIYYKKTGDGTVLAQGNNCSDWREQEFDALTKCIGTLYSYLRKPMQSPGSDVNAKLLPPFHAPPSPRLRRRSARLSKLPPNLPSVPENGVTLLTLTYCDTPLSAGDSSHLADSPPSPR